MIHMFSSLVNLKKNRGECRETNDVRRVKKRLLLPSSLGPRYPSRSLLFHFLPRGIWIVFLHCRCDPGVIFAGVAYELLGVLQELILVSVFHCILALGIDDGEHDLNRVQLVLADPAV